MHVPSRVPTGVGDSCQFSYFLLMNAYKSYLSGNSPTFWGIFSLLNVCEWINEVPWLRAFEISYSFTHEVFHI